MGHNKKQRNHRKNKKNKSKKRIENQFNQSEDKSNTEKEDLNEPQTEHVDLPNEKTPRKRNCSDNDSDVEDRPKKKKKKKQLISKQETTIQGKGKKSIRQMKKEKYAQRQAEAEAAAKDTLKQECQSYLSQWKHARDHWKFMKAKQVWLYKNKFSSKLVSDESWPVLLEYFEAAKGNIRNMLLDDANKIIKQMDSCIEKTDNDLMSTEATETDTMSRPDDTTYKRARDLIQHLQE